MPTLLSRALALALSLALLPTLASAQSAGHGKAMPPAGGSLRVLVRDMRQLPVPRALVSVGGTSLRGQTDEFGRVRFEHVPAGPYNVGARLGRFEGRADGRIQPGKLTRLTVRLAYAPPGDTPPSATGPQGSGGHGGDDSAVGELVGDVVDSTGNPQVFANVIVLGTRRGAPTDEQGNFIITRVPVGARTIKVQALLRGPAVVHANVGAGETVELHIVVPPDLPPSSLCLDEVIRAFHP